MLSIQNLQVNYGAGAALRGISANVPAGSIVAILGANGAGKTTTLKSICGLLPAKRGGIYFEGEPLSRLPPEKIVKKGVSMVSEGRRLFWEMTVLENLQVGAFVRSDKEGISKDIEQMFEYFPILKERKKQLAIRLSGGEQQMLSIARALMARPKLLLLDEPSLGLAPLVVNEIFRMMKVLNESGITILLVEQNARKALQYAHKAYVLEMGSVAMEGTRSELEGDQRFREAYLGSLDDGCEDPKRLVAGQGDGKRGSEIGGSGWGA